MHHRDKNKTVLARKRRAKRSRMHIRNQAKEVFGEKAKIVRLSVHRTPKHISVQAIDDKNSVTLASASTQDKIFRDKKFESKVEAATAVGKQLGDLLRKIADLKVAFDRSGYQYHGRIKAVADGIREMGIVF